MSACPCSGTSGARPKLADVNSGVGIVGYMALARARRIYRSPQGPPATGIATLFIGVVASHDLRAG